MSQTNNVGKNIMFKNIMYRNMFFLVNQNNNLCSLVKWTTNINLLRRALVNNSNEATRLSLIFIILLAFFILQSFWIVRKYASTNIQNARFGKRRNQIVGPISFWLLSVRYVIFFGWVHDLFSWPRQRFVSFHLFLLIPIGVKNGTDILPLDKN